MYRRDNFEVPEEPAEGKKKAKLIIMIVLAFFAVTVIYGLITVILFIRDVKGHFDESNKVADATRRQFLEALQKNYGLEKKDVTITDERGGGSGYPIYEFLTPKGRYTAEIGKYSVCTDYYNGEFYSVAEERIRAALKETEAFAERDFVKLDIDCIFVGLDQYSHRGTANLLPVWVNAAEIEKFKNDEIDKERWQKEVCVRYTIAFDGSDGSVIEKAQLESLRDKLGYFVEEICIRDTLGDASAYWWYNYNLRTNILGKDTIIH